MATKLYRDRRRATLYGRTGGRISLCQDRENSTPGGRLDVSQVYTVILYFEREISNFSRSTFSEKLNRILLFLLRRRQIVAKYQLLYSNRFYGVTIVNNNGSKGLHCFYKCQYFFQNFFNSRRFLNSHCK